MSGSSLTTVLGVAALLLLSGACSARPAVECPGSGEASCATSAPSTSGIVPTAAAPSPSASASPTAAPPATPPALTVPKHRAGEISRTVLNQQHGKAGDPDFPASLKSVYDATSRTRHYVVKAACVSTSTNVTIGYRINDARAKKSLTDQQRLLQRGQVVCDGAVTTEGIDLPRPDRPTTIDLDSAGQAVVNAYAVLVPASYS